MPRAEVIAFAARAATMIGELAARTTHCETALRIRAAVNQDKGAIANWNYGLSPFAYDQIRDEVRDKILAALFPESE